MGTRNVTPGYSKFKYINVLSIERKGLPLLPKVGQIIQDRLLCCQDVEWIKISVFFYQNYLHRLDIPQIKTLLIVDSNSVNRTTDFCFHQYLQLALLFHYLEPSYAWQMYYRSILFHFSEPFVPHFHHIAASFKPVCVFTKSWRPFILFSLSISSCCLV